MTKALTEADGASWREKLPPIPAVPLAVRQKLGQQTPSSSAEVNGARRMDKPGEESDLSPEMLLSASSAVKHGFRCV